MNIAEIIAPRKIEDIKSVYYGLDHYCRCGCGGTYHEVGTRGFKAAMTKLSKLEPVAVGTIMYTRDGRNIECEGVDNQLNYVNIPVDSEHDKCYCFYF